MQNILWRGPQLLGNVRRIVHQITRGIQTIQQPQGNQNIPRVGKQQTDMARDVGAQALVFAPIQQHVVIGVCVGQIDAG